MLRFLIGDIDAVSARATYRHQIPGIEDVVAATVQFANGAVGTLTTIWHDNLSRSSLRNVEIFCERRTIVISGDDWFGPVTWTDADGASGSLQGDELLEKTHDLAVGHPNPDAAFVLAALERIPAYPDFSVALEAHRVVEAMYESARQNGASIDVADIVAR
jgi:predicted dehydrogenase